MPSAIEKGIRLETYTGCGDVCIVGIVLMSLFLMTVTKPLLTKFDSPHRLESSSCNLPFILFSNVVFNMVFP